MGFTHPNTRRGFLQTTASVAVASALPWPARASSDEFATADATAQAALVKTGQVTPVELVAAA
jgi:hypothetical protein